MISYKNGTWGVGFAFSLTGSVFPRAMAWSLPSAVFAIGLSLFKTHIGYTDTTTTASLAMTAVTAFISILGFMIVFRSNQAWDRFWEGFTLVRTARGQWFNATSSLFAFCSREQSKLQEVEDFQEMMAALMSFLFATALSTISTAVEFNVLGLEIIDSDTLDFFDDFNGREAKIELILQWIQRTIVAGIDSEVLDIPAPILSRVFHELSQGVRDIASARKINDLPFPFHYAQMVAVMLMIFTVFAPCFTAYLFVTPWAAAASAFINVAVLWSVNYLAVDIEQPYSTSVNGLPLSDEIQRMNRLLQMLLLEPSKRTPHHTGKDGDASHIVKANDFLTSFGGRAMARSHSSGGLASISMTSRASDGSRTSVTGAGTLDGSRTSATGAGTLDPTFRSSTFAGSRGSGVSRNTSAERMGRVSTIRDGRVSTMRDGALSFKNGSSGAQEKANSRGSFFGSFGSFESFEEDNGPRRNSLLQESLPSRRSSRLLQEKAFGRGSLFETNERPRVSLAKAESSVPTNGQHAMIPGIVKDLAEDEDHCLIVGGELQLSKPEQQHQRPSFLRPSLRGAAEAEATEAPHEAELLARTRPSLRSRSPAPRRSLSNLSSDGGTCHPGELTTQTPGPPSLARPVRAPVASAFPPPSPATAKEHVQYRHVAPKVPRAATPEQRGVSDPVSAGTPVRPRSRQQLEELRASTPEGLRPTTPDPRDHWPGTRSLL